MNNLPPVSSNFTKSLPSLDQSKQYLWKHRKKISLAGAAAASTIVLYYYFKSDTPPPPPPSSGSSGFTGETPVLTGDRDTSSRRIDATILGREGSTSGGVRLPSSPSISSSSAVDCTLSRNSSATRPSGSIIPTANLEEKKEEIKPSTLPLASSSSRRQSVNPPSSSSSTPPPSGTRGRPVARRDSSKSRHSSRSRSPERSPSRVVADTKADAKESSRNLRANEEMSSSTISEALQPQERRDAKAAPKAPVVQNKKRKSRKSASSLGRIDESRPALFPLDERSPNGASGGGLKLSPERLRSLIRAEEELKQRSLRGPASSAPVNSSAVTGKRKIAELDERKRAGSESSDDEFDIIDSPTKKDMIQGDMDQMLTSRATLTNIDDRERISWVEAKYEELIRGMRIYFNSQPDAIDLSSVLGIISLWNTKEETFAKASRRAEFTLARHVPRFIAGIYKAAEVLRRSEFPVDQKEVIYKEFWNKFSDDVLDNPFYKILIGLRDKYKERGWINSQCEAIPFNNISDINVVLTFCHQITRAVFNGVRLEGFSDSLMSRVLDRAHIDKAKRLAKDAKASSEKTYLPNLSINNPGDLARVVRQDFEALDELTGSIEGGSPTEIGLKLLRNLRGHVDLDFAPLRMTNFAHLLYSKKYVSASGENKRIDFFRFGSPTFTNLSGEISIEPMLIGLLDSYREDGKKHGYFNFQSSKEKSRMQGDESGRVHAIKGISEEYPENFLFFSFPMDSKAWKLEGSAKSARTVASLTAIIKEDFLNKGQPACFDYPDLIPGASEEENRAAAERFFDETAAEVCPVFACNEGLFQDRADIKKSYQFFIMLALHGKFYKHFGLDSANGACKDAIDRAGSFIVLCMYLEMLLDMFKKEDGIRGESVKRINEKVRLLANLFPFMVKGQAVVPCRRDHFLSTMDYIDQNLGPVINFMLKLFPDANSGLAAESKQEAADIPALPDLSVFV